MEDGFAEDVYESANMAKRRLVLEFAKHSYVECMPRVDLMLSHMRQRGVRLSLDGFGTGFSDFDLLAGFRFDYVKMNRIFLAIRGEVSIEFLKSVTALVRTCGARVVAGGVEAAVERDVVLRSGIDLAQGHLYRRSMAVDQLRAFASASIKALQDDTEAGLKV